MPIIFYPKSWGFYDLISAPAQQAPKRRKKWPKPKCVVSPINAKYKNLDLRRAAGCRAPRSPVLSTCTVCPAETAAF